MKAKELQAIAEMRRGLNRCRTIATTAAIQLCEHGPDHTSDEIRLAYQMWGSGKVQYYEGIAQGISVALSALNQTVGAI